LSHNPSGVEFRILGPLEVLVNGTPIPLGGGKQRTLLAHLLCEPNRVQSISHLVGAIWDEDPDDPARSKLQVHISNLRKALAPATAVLGSDPIVTQAPGYKVQVTNDQLDLLAFEGHTRSARKNLESKDFIRASFRYGEALGLWRGEPLSDLTDDSFVRPIIARLQGARTEALVGRMEADLALGRHKDLVGELAGLVAANPLDERVLGLLMIALYRSGRQAESLSTFTIYRRRLADELGLDPGQTLCDLETKILAQDPDLEAPQPGQFDNAIPTLLRSTLARHEAHLMVDGERVDIDKPVITIGRRSDQDLVLNDPRASRQHGLIKRDADGFRYQDKSSNGTRINGQYLSEHVLESGDELLIGNTVLKFVLAADR